MWRLVNPIFGCALLVDEAKRRVVPGIVGAPAMPSLSCTAMVATVVWEFMLGGCNKRLC